MCKNDLFRKELFFLHFEFCLIPFYLIYSMVPSFLAVDFSLSRKNSWKQGLQLAWGDPQRLSESDVLRFQWPSIGSGWERGLIQFSRAQSQPRDWSDGELLAQVMAMEHTKVVVIYGTADKVIKPDMIRSFFQSDTSFTSIPLIGMPGMGHDPFEEDPDGFVTIVEDLVSRWTLEQQQQQ